LTDVNHRVVRHAAIGPIPLRVAAAPGMVIHRATVSSSQSCRIL